MATTQCFLSLDWKQCIGERLKPGLGERSYPAEAGSCLVLLAPVKESYVLGASGDRLTLELVVKGPMGKREFTRVFIREGSITIRVEELGAS